MTTHFHILAWEIPQTDEPGGLQSIESRKSRTCLSTHTHTHTHTHTPLRYVFVILGDSRGDITLIQRIEMVKLNSKMLFF